MTNLTEDFIYTCLNCGREYTEKPYKVCECGCVNYDKMYPSNDNI